MEMITPLNSIVTVRTDVPYVPYEFITNASTRSYPKKRGKLPVQWKAEFKATFGDNQRKITPTHTTIITRSVSSSPHVHMH